MPFVYIKTVFKNTTILKFKNEVFALDMKNSKLTWNNIK